MSYSLKLTPEIGFWETLSQILALDRLKESILFNILYLIGCIPWHVAPRKCGRPYIYAPTTVILRCFIVRIWWFRIDSNNGLHTFLNMDCCQYNRKLAITCGLVFIPSRRTFDRRLKTMSIDIKQRISTMGYLIVAIEGLVDLSITAIDSTLIKAKGPVWHASSMKKGIVPCPAGIDIDARWWGYSRAKGWIFGYKLHLTSTTGEIVVPLTADVTTTANVQDNRMYVLVTFSWSVFSLSSLRYMIADPGYDDRELYGYSKRTLGIDIVCPLLKDIKVLPKRGLSLYAFMNHH
jgi:hypothetical protein